MEIKWSRTDYDGYGGYHAMMLIGDYNGMCFVKGQRDDSIWTSLTFWWAKRCITRNFKRFNN